MDRRTNFKNVEDIEEVKDLVKMDYAARRALILSELKTYISAYADLVDDWKIIYRHYYTDKKRGHLSRAPLELVEIMLEDTHNDRVAMVLDMLLHLKTDLDPILTFMKLEKLKNWDENWHLYNMN